MSTRPTKTITDVFSERVTHYRKSRHWTQGQLLAEMASLGYPLDRASLSKIENGHTRADNVSLREVLVLAAALDVPPPLLFVPLGEDVDLYLTPDVKLDPHLAFDWVVGEVPFCVRGPDDVNHPRHGTAWTKNAEPIVWFQELRRLQDDCNRATTENFDRALELYMRHRMYMRRAEASGGDVNLSPPPIPDGWLELAQAAGFEVTKEDRQQAEEQGA